FKHSHDIALFHDEILDPVELDFGAGPFSEQNPVTDLQVDRNELASLVAASRTHGDDFALLRFLFGGIGNDDAAGGLFLGIDALDHDAIVERAELHGIPPSAGPNCKRASQEDPAMAKFDVGRQETAARYGQKNFGTPIARLLPIRRITQFQL